MQNASGFGGGTAAATPPTGGGGFMAMGGDGGLSAVQSAINDYLNGAEAIHQAEGVALSDVHPRHCCPSHLFSHLPDH